MFKTTSPPGMFAAVSLLMIVAMVVGTGLTQVPFFRQSIIEREAAIVRDMVNALALEHGVVADDFQEPIKSESSHRFDLSFNALKNFQGTARIKVFNPKRTIVWSDDANLVGTQRTSNLKHLANALKGHVEAVFNPSRLASQAGGSEKQMPETIECYVPIFSNVAHLSEPQVIGVLSLYRDPTDLNQTIRNGLYLLWAAVVGGGLLLFLALFKLFSLVYERQMNAESNFSKLTVEHERIVQIEKMSAMGELVGEIAHQLNNPLVGVINLTQLAERQIHDPQRVAELLVQVRKAGTECRDIVQRILRINQASSSTLQPTDLQELVQDTLVFCRQSIDLKHVVNFERPADKVTLHVDPVLIRQALFNLIHNAILAAPDKRVTVTLTRAERSGVSGVKLDVSDQGAGFDKATAAKLFKPFFTTRASGTGLGLSVAQHIAMKHGGVVLAENLPEGGARFSIWLPEVTQS